jgi:hypothetical protein
MSAKSVIVHTCFFATSPDKLGIGASSTEPIFHETPNSKCSCTEKISFSERNRRLDRGEIYILARRSDAGHLIPEWLECVALGKQTQLPIAQSITDKNIQSAYVGSRHADKTSWYQRQRIEEYGLLSREVLASFFAAPNSASSYAARPA